jgi:DNA gyrase subunit A
MTIRFTEDEVRPWAAAAAGVRGMKLRAGDEVVSCDVARDDTASSSSPTPATASAPSSTSSTVQGRGGQGVRGIKLTAKKG